ncbi:hypothetical protein AB0J14_04570 [Micromonospora arborensis]|uniref:hypothetical protein n=1 Tax=Micromonospora arborensis TaxID=2116518 RepID=UPI0033CF5851
MLTWEFICNVDPRLAEMEGVVTAAVLEGVISDRAYSDAKPYIGSLVGWRRGRAPAVAQPSLLQQRLAQIAAIVVFGPDDDRMSSQHAYEVAIGRIHDAVVRAASMRVAA